MYIFITLLSQLPLVGSSVLWCFGSWVLRFLDWCESGEGASVEGRGCSLRLAAFLG